MKIAYIGQKGIPAKLGGVERYVDEVATRMADRGHEVFAYVRNNYTPKELKKYQGVNLIHLPGIPTKNLDAISHTFLATIHAIFKGYDIVHYNSIGPTSLSFIFKICRWHTPIISTFQCQDYFHKKWGFFARAYLRFSEYLTCRIPDKTIVVSQSLSCYVKEKYGKDAIYVPNGAEVRSGSGDNTLYQWGIEKNKYVVAISRLVRHKGIHYLIKAWKNLEDKRQTKDTKLVIVGDGFHTDEYVSYLKKLAGERTSIIFTGALLGSELDQIFSNAYLFVQPSESEGLSLALLEAMGYGKAVLVSNIPENIEAIGEAGFTFINKDARSLEKELLELINNPEKVMKSGSKGKERIQKTYNWNDIADKIENLYTTLLQKRL